MEYEFESSYYHANVPTNNAPDDTLLIVLDGNAGHATVGNTFCYWDFLVCAQLKADISSVILLIDKYFSLINIEVESPASNFSIET